MWFHLISGLHRVGVWPTPSLTSPSSCLLQMSNDESSSNSNLHGFSSSPAQPANPSPSAPPAVSSSAPNGLHPSGAPGLTANGTNTSLSSAGSRTTPLLTTTSGRPAQSPNSPPRVMWLQILCGAISFRPVFLWKCRTQLFWIECANLTILFYFFFLKWDFKTFFCLEMALIYSVCFLTLYSQFMLLSFFLTQIFLLNTFFSNRLWQTLQLTGHHYRGVAGYIQMHVQKQTFN